jgi:single-stranded DNA-binding protein
MHPTGCETRVTVWGPLAETCAAHLTKGRLVGVSARLEPTAWEAADGAKRRGMEVIAGTVEFLDRPRRDGDSSEQQSQDIAVAA